ncbi:YidB family protein [Leptospira sp. 2 VSF19]|uniref:YidB family protein n=1 Tax=Leptospira soteropolitanensis TaxID=2950025 RepID=A0AAW5V9X5_9LEPT|nr:YidB family protein [Leptospira soteropolitanensis]MCW7492812.1 YidB family protein [Leptospira soteropolitanensis]MCW7500047.1 YidB family protein [Leptospira soteropolitanensis]MCW7522298.1 YidB family protein [Leptospira soteropolitanensis]MCW7526154.1 YidB family protein [Leptospira soteropolitanensis]MCW7529734.1 YidB family protein [Leptospira soteropolitanensis]
MSFFENLKAVAAQAVELVQNNPQVISGIQKIIEENGGVSGVVQKFKDKGFAEAAASWVGTGENVNLEASDVLKVLGSESVQELAKKVGLDSEKTAGLIGSLLPVVIDKLSPDGKEPGGDITSQLSSLASLFIK